MVHWNDVQTAIDACPIVGRSELKPSQTVITRAPYGNKQTWKIEKITPTGRIKGVRVGLNGDSEGEPAWLSKDCQQFRVMSDESIRLAKEWNEAKAAKEKRLLEEAAKARAEKEAYAKTIKGKIESLIRDYAGEFPVDQSMIDDYRQTIHLADVDKGLGRPLDVDDLLTDFANLVDACEDMLRRACYYRGQATDAYDELSRAMSDPIEKLTSRLNIMHTILDPNYDQWIKGA